MNKDSLVVTTFGKDRHALVSGVNDLLTRVQKGSEDYVNSSTVVTVPEQQRGKNGSTLGMSIELDVKDVVVLAAITQASLSYTSETDHGKTFLSQRCLSALFGQQDEHWWRVEVSRGMTVDDLIDVDLKQLSISKLSEAVSACKWLSFPARLLDEINRSHPKLNNLLLHIVDGSGLHLRGQLSIPIGLPYTVGDTEKRYSFTITTANEPKADGSYGGVFEQDYALTRRQVLSVNLDVLQPTARDRVLLTDNKRPRSVAQSFPPATEQVIQIHESLTEAIPYSSLGGLFLHYIGGRGTCIHSRSGHLRPEMKATLCVPCHLYKSHPFCGRVGGLSPGLLLWTKEIALGIAVIRAAKILAMVEQDCSDQRHDEVQAFLGSRKKGNQLYEAFEKTYLADLSVTGEDVLAAYTLIAPNHVYIDKKWLASQKDYEESETYAFADIGRKSYKNMCRLMMSHESLFNDLSKQSDLADKNLAEIQSMVTTEDSAFLSVIAALREKPLPLNLAGSSQLSHAG